MFSIKSTIILADLAFAIMGCVEVGQYKYAIYSWLCVYCLNGPGNETNSMIKQMSCPLNLVLAGKLVLYDDNYYNEFNAIIQQQYIKY